jgi:predicted MFS family arabinose efflux permease
VVLIGIGSCFFDPASQTEIPLIVGRDRAALARANGTFWAIDTLARALVGPTAGALLFAWSRGAPFLTQGILLAMSGLLLLGLPRRAPRGRTSDGPLMSEVRDGLRVLWASDVLRRNAVSMGTYNLAYNIAFATLILLLQDNLHLSSIGFGLLLACGALGGVVGGWIARHVTWSATAAYALGFAVQAAAWLVVLVAPHAWIAGLAFAMIGVVSILVSAVGGTASQMATPEGMLGRVTSVTRLVGLGAAAVGSAMSGVIADIGGLSAPIVVAAVVLAISASWAFLRR